MSTEQPVKRELRDINEWSKYYSHKFCCDNCGKYQQCFVRMKTPLRGQGIDCEKCGCYVRLK